MRAHKVFLAPFAEHDIEGILAYLDHREPPGRSDEVQRRFENLVRSLETSPSRGRIVPEARLIGLTDYREVFYGPYRLIYYIAARTVNVVAVLDGRRDLHSVLADRLLR